MITDATTQVSSLDNLRYQVTTIYAQLSQVLSCRLGPPGSPPSPGAPGDPHCRPSQHPLTSWRRKGHPEPMGVYPDWRNWMKCEIAVSSASPAPPPLCPEISVRPSLPAPPVPPVGPNDAGYRHRGLNRLPGGGAATTNPYFDQAAFDALATTTAQLIAIDQTEPEHDVMPCRLGRPSSPRKNGLVLHLAVLANALTGVQKDLDDLLPEHRARRRCDPARHTPRSSPSRRARGHLRPPQRQPRHTLSVKFLGRQVASLGKRCSTRSRPAAPPSLPPPPPRSPSPPSPSSTPTPSSRPPLDSSSPSSTIAPSATRRSPPAPSSSRSPSPP